jgi:hypothetical protein
MAKGGIVLKVPKGTPAPAGYKFVRSLRSMNVYAKEQAAPVPQSEINSLINSFSKMHVQVQASAEDDLEAAMKKLTIGGKRKSRKASRKNRKTRRDRR